MTIPIGQFVYYLYAEAVLFQTATAVGVLGWAIAMALQGHRKHLWLDLPLIPLLTLYLHFVVSGPRNPPTTWPGLLYWSSVIGLLPFLLCPIVSHRRSLVQPSGPPLARWILKEYLLAGAVSCVAIAGHCAFLRCIAAACAI